MKSFNTLQRYCYSGINSAGKRCRGQMMATSKHHLKQILNESNITPTSIRLFINTTLQRHVSHISQHDIAEFTQALANLLSNDVPLNQALTLLVKHNNCAFDLVLQHITQLINNGHSLAFALARYPSLFDHGFCKMVDAGELSGTLIQQLQQLHLYQQQQLELKQKLTRAAIYPACVLSTAIVTSLGLLLFVIPRFADIYQSFNAQLPWLTQQILLVSKTTQQHSLAIFITAIICICIAKAFINPFQIPLLKSYLAQQRQWRWLHLLATAINAHLPLLAAIELANHSIQHLHPPKRFHQLPQLLLQGLSLHQALTQLNILNQSEQHMIALGEQSGTLNSILSNITQQTQLRLSTRLEHLCKLLEPVIMVVLAILMGILILALYLPILQFGRIAT